MYKKSSRRTWKPSARLMKKGAFGAGVFQTADCRKTYEEMKAKGVEFLSPPKDQFYGVEAVFRDPFWQLVQHDPAKKHVTETSIRPRL